MFADDRRMSAALDAHITREESARDGLVVTDLADRLVEVGTRVRISDYDPHHPDWRAENHANYMGVVAEVEDWEADVDDEGRTIGIRPHVVVRFDSGDRERFTTIDWDLYGEGGQVDDVCVIGPPDVGFVRLIAEG